MNRRAATKQRPPFHEPSSRAEWAQPFQGFGTSTPQSQGSSFLATLDFEAESLWDSRFEKFMVTMRVPRTLRLSMNHRTNMPLLTELGEGPRVVGYRDGAPTEL